MTTPAYESTMRQQLLQLSLRNAVLGVPIQTLAVGYIVYLAMQADRHVAALACAVVGLLVGLTRPLIARRWRDFPADELVMNRITRQLEVNAAGAGLLWVISTFFVYTHLSGSTALAYVIMSCGSVSIAGISLAFAGRSFMYLALPELGSLVIVSLLPGPTHSVPLSILITIFGITLFSGTKSYLALAETAIRQRVAADKANESLLQAMTAAEAANVAKSQFLATISHEIRTPMNGVLGSLDLLRDSPLNAEQKRLVNTAASSGFSLLHILNDVLDHSKIEAGKLTLAHAPMSLVTVASSVAALFRANAQAKGLELILDVDPRAADRVLGDAQRLKQVLLNLVGNAIKFTDQGSVKLQLRPAPGEDDRQARVIFEVIDTGIGISAEATKRLFEPFHQVESGHARKRGGTGLGLSISQRIAEAMGSAISVRANEPNGSVFAFALGLERDRSTNPRPIVDSGLGEFDKLPSNAGTVLVVEDNSVNRMIAMRMLDSLSVDAIEAESGKEALEQLGKRHVRLVMMDLQMPEMDGYETVRHIREREARLGLGRLPIVALTANVFDDDLQRAREAGMDGHLTKPYTRAQMSAVLTSWLT